MDYTKEQIDLLDEHADYLQGTKCFFDMTNPSMKRGNHVEHDTDPNYWNILLKDVIQDPERWKNKLALDFACGCGRNMRNLLNTADFKRADGCDVSRLNAEFSQEYIDSIFGPGKCIAWETDGLTLHPAEDNTYDFVMTHQSLSHIGIHAVRLMLLKEMYRVLKPEGILSIHYMNLGAASATYFDNTPICPQPLTRNVNVQDSSQVLNELEKIGFRNVTYVFTGRGTEYNYTRRPEYWFRGIK